MNTDEALDKMMKCLPHIEALRKDEVIEKQAEKKNPDLLWLMIGRNRRHTYAILSIVLDKDVETIKKQDITETYKDITQVMGGEFMTFFTLLSRLARTM